MLWTISFQAATVRLKPAPGNQSGMCLRMGNVSTRNAPGTNASLNVATPVSTAVTYWSFSSFTWIPYEMRMIVDAKEL